MLSKSNRFFSLIVVLGLVAGCFSGCGRVVANDTTVGSGTGAVSSETTVNESNKPVKISKKQAKYYQYTEEGRKEKILLYLETKYEGHEFEVIEMTKKIPGAFFIIPPPEKYITYIAYCVPKGGDPEKDKFEVDVFPQDNLVYEYKETYAEDTYFAFIIRPECESLITEIISKHFSDFEVNVYPWSQFYDYKLGIHSTLEDMLNPKYKEKQYSLSAQVTLLSNSYSMEATLEKIKNIREEIIDNNLPLVVGFSVVTTDENGTEKRENKPFVTIADVWNKI